MTRTSTSIAAVAIVLGLTAAACGDDNTVRDDVANAAEQVDQAAKTGDEKDLENAEQAVAKADEAITDRLNEIQTEFDKAESKIGEDARSAYETYRTDLAAVGTSASAAVTAAASGDDDGAEKAWNEMVDKAKDLTDRATSTGQQLDEEAQKAVDKLGTDLQSLVEDVEAGLR